MCFDSMKLRIIRLYTYLRSENIRWGTVSAIMRMISRKPLQIILE